MWNVLQTYGGRIAVGCNMELECGLLFLLVIFGLAFGTDIYEDY